MIHTTTCIVANVSVLYIYWFLVLWKDLEMFKDAKFVNVLITLQSATDTLLELPRSDYVVRTPRPGL